MATVPLLSIGIIFKNEERCLERCLKSLDPLRKAVPCELVMADTGATDNSRKVAERYADQLFDFIWTDDFAAARNAVMDRCRGKWYLSIDCDEWLDEDITELVDFLKKPAKVDYAFLTVRNYLSGELDEQYSDFPALRLARMAVGQRYVGIIHESWPYREPAGRLTCTVLHHDGYVHASRETARQKLRRNMRLLRRELENDPENLRTLNECIDSSRMEPEHIEYIRTAVTLVQKGAGEWKTYGGCILRSAAKAAYEYELPELWSWIEYSEHTFPDSVFTLIDLHYVAFRAACDETKWLDAVHYGEAYCKAVQALYTGNLGPQAENDLLRSTLHFSSAAENYTVQIGLANAHLQNNQPEQALEILSELDATKLSTRQIQNTVVILGELHARTMLDVSGPLMCLYDLLSQNRPNEQKRQARCVAFDAIAATAFTKEYRDQEKEHFGNWRPAYTVFRCLSEQCEAGRAAALMMTTNPAEIHDWLAKVENWQALPIEALEYALQSGIAFPLEEKPLPVEVLDGLAVKLTKDDNMARQIVLTLADNQEYPDLQSLFWVQSLVLAALRSFDWTRRINEAPVNRFVSTEKENVAPEGEKPGDAPEIGFALIRRFAQVESILLPILYTSHALAEENTAILPPMHRWGLFCGQALSAMDTGDSQEYLAALRKGLKACPGEKDTVQFLLDNFRQDSRSIASPELLALAEKVRMILAAYDPADPAVTALKASPAYQQVAWLIEDTNAGGMPS